jgi:site-specific recombinase XerD
MTTGLAVSPADLLVLHRLSSAILSSDITLGDPGGRYGVNDADVVALYEQHLTRKNLSRATIQRRLRCVELLRYECGDLFDLGADDVETFLDKRALGPVTRTNWLSHLGSFYGWAVVHEHTARNPIARLTRPRLRRKLPRPISELELRRALAESRSAMLTCWLLLGAYAGLRCMEIAGLRGEQVDLDRGELRVVGKGDKERVVPIHDKVAAALEPFCGGPGPLFIGSITGDSFTPAQVSRLIGGHFRRCGINATAHQLRHRFASQILEETGDIAIVAELCGHESLETARIYAEVSNRRKRSAVDLLH